MDSEEFKKSIDDITLHLMAVLQSHQTPVAVAVESLTAILAGAVAQIENRTVREKVKKYVAECLEDIEAPDAVNVDLSDRLEAMKN